MKCTQCGEPVGDKVKFCRQCGAKVNQPKPDVPPKQMNCTYDLRILLVGHTGHGKSATGNSLLGITGQEGFHHGLSTVSVTKEYEGKIKERFGRRLYVVDTPSIFETSFNDKTVYQHITRCIELTLPGFNAICLVLRPDRFTKELVESVEFFINCFGKGVDEYTFVIWTHMKTEEKMINYMKEGETNTDDEGQKAFQVLRKRCQEKLLFIDNSASKDVKEEMAWNILTAIDAANAKASRPYFQSKMSTDDLRILLIGLSGHGKSATGNSLLGKSWFTENSSTEENACQQTKSGESRGRKITIVEFMAKNPSSKSDGDSKKLLYQTEKILHPGFHAVCFVIDPNRITDVKDQFQPIIEYFGDEANDFAFVIMTFTKSKDEFEKNFPNNFQVTHPGVKTLLRFCKDKVLYIDNMVSSQEREAMVEDILIFIDSEKVKKRIPYFSSHFKRQADDEEDSKADEKAESPTEAAIVSEAAIPAEAVRAAKAVDDEKTAEAERDSIAERVVKADDNARPAEAAMLNKAKRAIKTDDDARAAEAQKAVIADRAFKADDDARAAKADMIAIEERTVKAADKARAAKAERSAIAKRAVRADHDATAAEADRAAIAERAVKAVDDARLAEAARLEIADRVLKAADDARAAEAARLDIAERAVKAADDSRAEEDERAAIAQRIANTAEDARAAEAARLAIAERAVKAADDAKAAEAARLAIAVRAVEAAVDAKAAEDARLAIAERAVKAADDATAAEDARLDIAKRAVEAADAARAAETYRLGIADKAVKAAAAYARATEATNLAIAKRAFKDADDARASEAGRADIAERAVQAAHDASC